MATASDAIWAIDLGSNSLKALHLAAVGEAVQVIGFDHVPHGKILSSSGISAAEREELVAISLRQFVQRNEVDFDPIIISVPSQNSFARFVTLPPVEAKRLPEIVKFEAAQQIPFDISEVQWDYQLLSDPDSPEKKVGLFAIKNEVVHAAMEPFEREELPVSYVQMASMALYNYLLFDRPDLAGSDKRATVIINIGADSTDVVVCTASGVWQRCIMMGGNAFTSAIADTFKLSFEKAEKLKRTAPVSKYARQIFQAMRPVFTDWTGEVQRSLGFYTSSNPDVKLARVVAMGGGTKLRGLLKYLQQTLQIPVEKPDTFKRLSAAPGVSAAKFHANVADFGVVYGLGLQGLGMARIESNLLPSSVARSIAWAGKIKYFYAAALMLLVVSAMSLARVGLIDRVSYARNEEYRFRTRRVVNEAEQIRDQTSNVRGQTDQFDNEMKQHFSLFRHREIIPQLHDILFAALPNARTNPQDRELHEAFERGDVKRIMQIPRSERRQLFLTTVSVFYSDNLETAQFRPAATMRRDSYMQDMYGEEDDPYDMGEMDDMMMEIYGDMYREMYGPDEVEEKVRGFVVMIEGYSPYKNIAALLDPPNVRHDPSRWGFVTRLEHLQQFLGEAGIPFKLYSKVSGHFKLDTGPVDVDSDELPVGVGIWQFTPRTAPTTGPQGPMMVSSHDATTTLIDPMTQETISAEPLVDQFGNRRVDNLGRPAMNPRDYWFRLQFKLQWHDAPETPAGTGGQTRR